MNCSENPLPENGPLSFDSCNQGLFSFIQHSPTAYHAVSMLRKRLLCAGFREYQEGFIDTKKPGLQGFVIRNGALIAFSLCKDESLSNGLRMLASHTDSPSLQIKPNVRKDHTNYLQAGIEVYGGALLRSWYDRELSLAGRVSCRMTDGQIKLYLIDLEKPVVCLPSLALHLDRTVNEGQKINSHTDLCPIFANSGPGMPQDLSQIVRHYIDQVYINNTIDTILGFDLFCYDASKPAYCGLNDCFIAAPRLDNLLSCYVGVEAICQHSGLSNCLLLCMNHEEVGSTSQSGALGNFADLVLTQLLPDPSERSACLHRSFLVSLDNAHASHPNFPDKSDGDHEILLNYGPVIKINASQRYSTSAATAALFRSIAAEMGVKTQNFVMRSDMACGSTIGPLVSARLGVDSVDIGAATWGMHSIRETTGSKDPYMLLQTTKHFFNCPKLPLITEHWG